MWFLLRLLGSIALAIVLGLGSAYVAAFSLRGDSQLRNGPWQTNLLIGSSTADPYIKTYIALTGLLALNKSETLYFEAHEDSAGKPLDGKCSYRIDGKDPDARWWSLTVYGSEVSSRVQRWSRNGNRMANIKPSRGC